MDTHPMVQVLDPSGRTEVPIALDREQLSRLYRWMVLGRAFDERALALQRQGRIGTYAPFSGQEAAIVGSAFALQHQDWIFPTYREVLSGIMHGVPISDYLLLFQGHAKGNSSPEAVNVFPIQISIGTHIPHAVGAAWAAKLLGHDAVVLAYFGDGATSKGDFHEALNFAGVFKVPVVFLCQNNQWAISVPRTVQTASATLAQKAVAYGFEGIQVDGMDVLAVYEVTRAAVDKARHGGGPTLIEAVCYRFGPHTTADDATRYRDEAEVARWRALDSLPRLRNFLVSKGLWDDEREACLWQEARDEIARAVEAAEAVPPAEPQAIFDNAYALSPATVLDQRRMLVEGG